MTPKERQEFCRLMNALREDTLTDEQFIQLDRWISTDRAAGQIYVDYTKMWAELQMFQASANPCVHAELTSKKLQDETGFNNSQLWQALSDEEKKAPVIQTFLEEPSPPLVYKVEHPKVRYRVRRSTIVSLTTALAALVLLMLFVRFAPPKSGMEVATLFDSVDAEWGMTNMDMRKGVRVATSSRDLYLKKGIVELLFDNDTRVTLEGPAEFQVLSSDLIHLNYGRLYAAVTKAGYGFQISTGESKIIDLGTEFGVQKDLHGTIELHVIKGKTCLISGSGNQNIDLDVLANSAVRLNTETGRLNPIECDEQLFARKINSKLNLIWRGDTAAITVPNSSFEYPYLGSGESMYGVDSWLLNGPAGVTSTGSENSQINLVSNDGRQMVIAKIDGNLIQVPNRDGNQIAWMNTNVGTSLTQFLPVKFAAGVSYELTVGLACGAWNRPDDADELQIQFCYEDITGELIVLAATAVRAADLNLSDGGALTDYAVRLKSIRVSDKCVGQRIGIRILSTCEDVPAESGDWVIDNVRVSADDSADLAR